MDGERPGASAEVQAALLEEADGLRARGGDGNSWRSLTVYRALVGRFGAACAADLDRATWMCLEDPSADDVTRRFAELALRHPDPAERLLAETVLADCDLRAHDDPSAEARLRRILPRARGRGDVETELRVCQALANVFGSQRREIEALVLVRRVLVIVESDPTLHPVYEASALAALADAYRSLVDLPRMALVLARMERLAARLTEPDAGRFRGTHRVLSCDLALRGGDPAAARRHLEAAREEAARDPGTAGHSASGEAILASRIALAEDDVEAAAAIVRTRKRPRVGGPTMDLAWAIAAVDVAARRGRRAEAESHAHAAFSILDGEGRAGRIGTGTRLRLAEDLATALSREGVEGELAARAWRAAADAALDRLFELDRCARELPELSAALPDDRAALAEYRERFVRGHQRVLSSLREILADSAPAEPSPPGPARRRAAWRRSARGAGACATPTGPGCRSGTSSTRRATSR